MIERLFIEGLGTYMIVSALVITGNENPITIGLVIFVITYLARRISGAHFNPAITTATCLSGRIDMQRCFLYILSQFLGAVAALYIFRLGAATLPILAPNLEGALTPITIIETILTLIVALVFLRAQREEVESRYFGLCVALAYTAALSIGGLLNPAIAASSLVLSMINGSTLAELGNILPILIGAPLLGGVAAAFIMPVLDSWSEKTL